MFSNEFVAGMTTPHRTRILGDLDENAPARWEWGEPERRPIDVVLLALRAGRGRPAALEAEQTARLAAGGLASATGSGRPTSTTSSRSASATGSRSRSSRGSRKTGPPEQTVRAGEFLLGYRTSTACTRAGRCSTDAPTRKTLPRDAEGSGLADLGATAATSSSGSCARTCPGSGASRRGDAARRRDAATRRRGCGSPSKMVGRWPSGAPLALAPDADDPSLAERERLRLPRARPARGPLPGRLAHPPLASARLARSRAGQPAAPGRSTAATASCGAAASTGPSLTIEEALAGGDTTERGLHFICLNANIQRQFEFINHTWLNNPKFGGLYDDADPSRTVGAVRRDVHDPDRRRPRARDGHPALRLRQGRRLLLPARPRGAALPGRDGDEPGNSSSPVGS